MNIRAGYIVDRERYIGKAQTSQRHKKYKPPLYMRTDVDYPSLFMGVLVIAVLALTIVVVIN